MRRSPTDLVPLLVVFVGVLFAVCVAFAEFWPTFADADSCPNPNLIEVQAPPRMQPEGAIP